VNELAAARAVQAIVAAPERLLTLPRLGSSVEGYEPREVRRLLVGPYELRYEVFDAEVVVLRVWHAREER
jgi:plasmid stabilization system protein ParE